MVTMHKPTVLDDGPTSITISDWKMVVLIIADIHWLTANRTLTFSALENFFLLILVKDPLRIESDTDSAVPFFAPQPIVLRDLWA
jgi:hypothetical protein